MRVVRCLGAGGVVVVLAFATVATLGGCGASPRNADGQVAVNQTLDRGIQDKMREHVAKKAKTKGKGSVNPRARTFAKK